MSSRMKFNYIPDPAWKLEDQSPIILLAMAIWGEARGEDRFGMASVAQVMMNRATWRARTGKMIEVALKEVLLQRYQFSCFNMNDPNRHKLNRPLMHDTIFIWFTCLREAFRVFYRKEHDVLDHTQGATHYHVKDMPHPPWYFKQAVNVTEIGNHVFYNLPGEWGYGA